MDEGTGTRASVFKSLDLKIPEDRIKSPNASNSHLLCSSWQSTPDFLRPSIVAVK